jgi:hypothetical protein
VYLPFVAKLFCFSIYIRFGPQREQRADKAQPSTFTQRLKICRNDTYDDTLSLLKDKGHLHIILIQTHQNRSWLHASRLLPPRHRNRPLDRLYPRKRIVEYHWLMFYSFKVDQPSILANLMHS